MFCSLIIYLIAYVWTIFTSFQSLPSPSQTLPTSLLLFLKCTIIFYLLLLHIYELTFTYNLMNPFVLLICISLLILFMQYILFKFNPSPTSPRSSLHNKLYCYSMSFSQKKNQNKHQYDKNTPKNIKQKIPQPQ